MSVPVTRLFLRVSSLDNQAAAEDISSSLSESPGIGLVEPDWQRGTVLVETANDDGGKDVLRKLRDAGYPAEDITADFGRFERG
ncbi:hypothetical protein BH11ARM2_BH11ARM2_22980 [soil metagenome]